MQFSTVAALSALSASAMAAYANGTVTTDITVTGYTTYCPEPTIITITKCEEVCHPTTITVNKPTTITITEPCIVPTTIAPTTNVPTTTLTSSVAPVSKSSAAASSSHSVSSFVGAGAKNAAGVVAGVAAVAAALL